MRYSDDYFGFRPYVPVAARRAQAARELAKLTKKGHVASPVAIEGRAIARTFWGKAWCDNLERYSDYANRLPRGRTYARNGSVVDLHVRTGQVSAFVSGSRLYQVSVTVAPVPAPRWSAICRDCSGAIDSLVELLQGRLSEAVMTRLCQEQTGLFPSPKDIRFSCSCPDWASMCKHVAAALYGIGARLDRQPELLFTLRQVDSQELIAKTGTDLAQKSKGRAGRKVLANEDLSEMFGIEMAPPAPPVTRGKGGAKKWASASPKAGRSTPDTPPSAPEPPRPPKAQARKKRKTGALTPAKHKAVAERMRKYWAARRKALSKRKVSE